jgi:hypothetical protein
MILNRHVLNVVRGADDGKGYNARPHLAVAYIGKDFIESTDGSLILRAPLPPQGKTEDYPPGWKDPLGSLAGKVIPVAIVQKLMKMFEKKDDTKFAISPSGFVSWGRENREAIEVNAPEANRYPDTSKIFPTEEPKAKVRLNVAYLEELIRVAKAQSKGRDYQDYITFRIYDYNRAVRIEISGVANIIGMLSPMSMRDDE